jgi:hypothetical protein
LARTLAAANTGRARWVEQMREAIMAGEIERFPGGRPKGSKSKPKGLPAEKARPTAPVADAAPVAIADDKTMEQRAGLVKWRELSRAEKLNKLADDALDIVRWIYSLDPNAEVNPRVLSAKKDAALTTLMLTFKVGEAAAEREAKERQRQEILDGLARQLEGKR